MKPYAPSQRFRIKNTDAPLSKPVVAGYMRYRNFEPLAQGGTCIIQTCLDTNLGRTVVFKRLHDDYQDDSALQQRFIREARITSQIQHPNTPPVYELGRDKFQYPYFTMKRVEGITFQEILKRLKTGDEEVVRAYPLFRQLEVFTQVAMAAAYAHECGVVHRDLKPANIQVGNFGEVILLDWGLAKVMDDPEDLLKTQNGMERISLELTRVGSKLGTPLYMSPEQVKSAADLDGRSDVFSMGIILYEILTQEQLFHGKDADEVRQDILDQEIQPPSTRAKRYVVPRELDAICMKALARDLNQRYQSLIDLINDLDAFRAGGSISAIKEGNWLMRQLRKLRIRLTRPVAPDRDAPRVTRQ